MAKFFFTQQQNIELIVEGGNPSGGSVIATMVWMNALKELGHDIILSKIENDPRPILKKYSWIETYPIYNTEKGIPKIRWLTYRFPKIFYALKLSKCHYLFESIPSWSSFLLGILCQRLGIKHIIRISNDLILNNSNNIRYSYFERQLISFGFRMCDFIITQNEYQYQTLKERFPNKKILKISNPIVLDNRFLNSKHNFSGYLAWLANFRSAKNMELLYNIAIKCKKEQFKIAGEPLQPLDEETAEYLPKLKALPNVEFLGKLNRDEIHSFLFNAKFLLNTSRYEGFSNTFLEAMQVGTPILTTKKVNPDEIISQYDLGLIYENEEDLKQKMASISETDYTIKSQNCVDYLKRNHDHLELGRRFLNFLDPKT